MFTLAFWRATLERVIASIAGGALAALGAGAIDALSVSWKSVGSIALGAGLASLLKALVAVGATGGGPSFTNAETLTPEVAAVEPKPEEAPGKYAAGPAADVPEGAPVDVTPTQDEPEPKDDQPKPLGGYWGGV